MTSGGVRRHPERMSASQLLLTELLTLVGLITATIEYGEIIQRRALRRRAEDDTVPPGKLGCGPLSECS